MRLSGQYRCLSSKLNLYEFKESAFTLFAQRVDPRDRISYSVGVITCWNDDLKRTKQEVIDMFRTVEASFVS